MRAVGVRELKDHLSDYVRAASEGEIVLVTHRDRVVASIGPPPRFGGGAPEDALDRLAASGALRRGSGRFASATADPLPAPSTAIDLASLLADARADR